MKARYAAKLTHVAASLGTTRARLLGSRIRVALLSVLGLAAIGSFTVLGLLDVPETAAAEPLSSIQITPLHPRQGAEIRSLTLFYEASWSQWLQAGSIKMSFWPENGKQGPLVRAVAKAKSSGPARLLWPYESSTRTAIAPETLYPLSVTHLQTERNETSTYEARYRNGRMVVQSTSAKKGRDAIEREQHIYDLEQIRDILSGLLYLQQTELPDGKEIRLLVQPLDRLYLVSFKVAGSERRTVLEKDWSTKRLEVEIRRIEDDFTLAPYRGMRTATMWLSDDRYRVPVEIQADLLVGFVDVRLVRRN